MSDVDVLLRIEHTVLYCPAQYILFCSLPFCSESAIPVDVGRQRELKWLDMFSHWDKWLSRRFQKVSSDLRYIFGCHEGKIPRGSSDNLAW